MTKKEMRTVAALLSVGEWRMTYPARSGGTGQSPAAVPRVTEVIVWEGTRAVSRRLMLWISPCWPRDFDLEDEIEVVDGEVRVLGHYDDGSPLVFRREP